MTDKKASTRDLELDDLRDTIREKGGRRYLARLMLESGVLSSSYDTDPRDSAMLEGKRMMGLKIYNDLKDLDPDIPLNLMKELQNDRRNGSRHSD